MERSRQNLFLFFEENDDEKDISSNLVHLYMNRFVIAEEDQTEIIGVYNLANPHENTPMIEFNSQELFEGETLRETQFWKENRTKLEHDESVFGELGSEIIKADVESVKINNQLRLIQSTIKEFFYNSANHYIIGSSFFVNSSMRRRIFINKIMQNWIDNFYRNFHLRLSTYFRELKSKLDADDIYYLYRNKIDPREFDKIRDREFDREFGRKFDYDNFNIQTLITIVRGSHSKLLTGEQLKAAHITSENESDLINDDLEDFHKLTMAQTVEEKRIDDFKCLSFYKQLTDPEVEKLKPFQYEIDMKQQSWKSQKSCFLSLHKPIQGTNILSMIVNANLSRCHFLRNDIL